MSRGHLEFRKRIRNALDLDVAALRDVHRAAERVRQLAKDLRHLSGGLEIKLVRRKLHATLIAHGLPGLDAQQHFLSMRVVVVEVVTIISRNQGDAGLFRKPDQFAVYALFDLQALVLNLKEEVPLTEDIAEPVGILL